LIRGEMEQLPPRQGHSQVYSQALVGAVFFHQPVRTFGK
jgi:hypothetical protein